jgi:uncharacterized protein YdeI (YjbR/CyaY-like superfamily)
MHPQVDRYLAKAKTWKEEATRLRAILVGCGLAEELKWGTPCYTLDGANVVLIHAFKDYCAVLFFKGALLKDPQGVLVQQSANTQATRQMRFTSLREVEKRAATLKAYVREAVAIEKAGLKVAFKKTAEFARPPEFEAQLAQSPALKKAFAALTPGRQRAYLLYFSAAKQAKTREARIAKCTPDILAGKGLDD